MRLQLVPRLPPTPDGLGQYAGVLHEAWSAAAGGSAAHACSIVAGDPEAPLAAGPDANVSRLGARDSRHVLEALEPASSVLVHYVGYGYDPRGCPSWLIASLEEFRRRRPDVPMVTFFHEIYASGPPWTSAFWLSGRQKSIACRLAAISDHAVTSMPLYAEILRPWLPVDRPARALALVSTVGEIDEPPEYETRPNRLVVFGSEGVRQRAWTGHRREIEAVCRHLAPDEIVDIGPGDIAPASFSGRPVRRLGALTAAEVSRTLLEARSAFLAYPPGFLPKSTIFAAYAAHGLFTARAWRGHSPASAYREHGICWNVEEGILDPASDVSRVAARAASWYHGHRIAVHRDVLASLLNGPATPGPAYDSQGADALRGTPARPQEP